MAIIIPEGTRAIVFDVDGVIIDSNAVKTDCFRRVFQYLGDTAVEEVVNYHISNPQLNRYKKIDWVVDNFDLDPSDHSLLYHDFDNLCDQKIRDCEFILGFDSFFRFCEHRDYELGVSSAMPRQSLLRCLQQFNLLDRFQYVFGSEITKAESLKMISKSTNCLLGNILFLGDSHTDYAAAREVGAQFVGINFDSYNKSMIDGEDILFFDDFRSLIES